MDETTKTMLAEHFDISEHGTRLTLKCKKCLHRWSMAKDTAKMGNVLRLLNHVASHDSQHGRQHAGRGHGVK